MVEDEENDYSKKVETLVHVVLHPRGIAPTLLGADFIPIISTKGINQIKKGKL